MKFSSIAVAVAAALLSLGAVAQEKKQDTQAGQSSPATSQSSRPSASGGASASSEKKAEGSASAGGSAAAGAGKSGKGGMGQSHSPELIKQVQSKLKEQGHDAGPADGKMGPKTQAGIKAFQQAKGMKATGQLDKETMSALGVDAASAGGSSARKQEGNASSGGSAPAPSGSSSAGGEQKKQ